MNTRARLGSGLAAAGLVLSLAAALPAQDRVKDAIDKGTRWLVSRQNPDGGYGPFGDFRVKDSSDAGITAFVLYAIARNPRGYKAEDGPFISRAVDFLLARQQPDGGIYDPKDPALQNYKTSVAILALVTLDRLKYADAIQRAQAFVKSNQFTEADGYDPSKHVAFGGSGYGSGLRPDLSNTQYTAEALAESGLSGSDEFWRKMVVYIDRCQNADSVDPLLQGLRIGTTRDGGYRYAPNETRGPEETLDDGTRIMSSYGSMTYAALKSLLYASVDRNDPRVQQAFAWISRHFTVRENPGMATRKNPKAGLEGLFYYYHTMAKALSVHGEPVIKDANAVEHRWAKELSDHLVSIQNEQGYWQNTSDRWWENIAALDTAYALVALSECQDALAREATAPAPAGGKSAGPEKNKADAKP
jgi:squalene-hopene/tetraprenyl-beta-curcumene cyclase